MNDYQIFRALESVPNVKGCLKAKKKVNLFNLTVAICDRVPDSAMYLRAISRKQQLFYAAENVLLNKVPFTVESDVHGYSHTVKVLIIAIMLGDILGIKENEMHSLVLAALYHDCGREDDREDEYHGHLSADKLKTLVTEISDNKDMSGQYAKHLIELHSLSDEEGFEKISELALSKDEQDKLKLLLEIFKDADGLDRVRIHDLNPSYLRTVVARTPQMILLAGVLNEIVN